MLNSTCMKNVTYIAGPKNGEFVNARMAGLHHSSEVRVGMAEAVVALTVLALVVGFIVFLAI
jgi:hypothetical protein